MRKCLYFHYGGRLVIDLFSFKFSDFITLVAFNFEYQEYVDKLLIWVTVIKENLS